MRERLRAGIIGLGGIAQSPPGGAPHSSLGTAMPYSHASSYAELSDEIELVAVCDIVPEQRERFEQRWGNVWPDLRTYADHTEMLALERLDIVSVCTPDALHRQPVVDACKAGVRGVLCEKPLATSLEDADAMIRAAREAGTFLSVDHTRRWMPQWQKARQLVNDGEIGNLFYVQETMTGPGNAMMFRNACHGIDLINFFAGSRPVWVWSELDPDFDNYGRVYRGSGVDRSRDPGANVYIAYESGVRGIHIGFQKGVRDLNVLLIGDKGKIEITDRSLILTLQPDFQNPMASPNTFVSRQVAFPFTTRGGIAAAIAELAQCVRSGTPPEISPAEEARKTVAIMVGALESHDRGGIKVQLHP